MEPKICTIEYYFDTENSEIYMRIPELSDGYIKMNMEQMTLKAVEEADRGTDSSFTTSVDLADSMNSYFSTLENLPEADLVTSILTRYTDIIFDNVADAENPGAQEAVAGDVRSLVFWKDMLHRQRHFQCSSRFWIQPSLMKN